jgi:transmembrane sensor
MKVKENYNVDWTLLASYVTDNISKEDKARFENWIEGSDKNKQIVEQAERAWNLSKNIDLVNLNTGKAWNKVNEKAQILTEVQNRPLIRIPGNFFLKIAAILIVAVFSWYLINKINSEINVKAGNSLVQLALYDGSKVDLNKNTQLKYPKRFKSTSREVYLKGEGFFNIYRNPQKPFIIHTSNTIIKVLGTSFDVNANSDGNVDVIVNSGIVSLKSKYSKQEVILNKDEKGTYLAKNSQIIKSVNSDQNYLSWKTKKFIFRECNLGEVFDKLEKVYDIQIILKDSGIRNYKLTATYEKHEAIDIMKMICLTFGFKICENENVYTIENKISTKSQAHH